MSYWYWLVITIILMIFEMITFTSFFLFLALTTLVTSIIVWFFPSLTLNVQIAITFFLGIFALLFAFLVVRKVRFKGKRNINVNDRMSSKIGSIFTLCENVESGSSKIKIGDTFWKVLINAGNKGDKVKVIDFKSTLFIVEKID